MMDILRMKQHCAENRLLRLGYERWLHSFLGGPICSSEEEMESNVENDVWEVEKEKKKTRKKRRRSVIDTRKV